MKRIVECSELALGLFFLAVWFLTMWSSRIPEFGPPVPIDAWYVVITTFIFCFLWVGFTWISGGA
jgi:hypothetical protein